MPRRPHKKSRGGCAECKRRHIKCDEHHPQCVNCATASSDCSFQKEPLSRPRSAAALQVPPEGRSGTSTPRPEYNGTKSWSHPSPLPVSDPSLNLDHLELLHHFCTNTYITFTDEAAQQQVWQVTAIRYGLSYPFLLSELLAISALHLGYLKPPRQEHYYTKAIELQSNALNGFNAVQKQVDEQNCGAILMFASLLALHVLADPTRIRGLDFNEYLDHLLSCIRLMRSVHSLVIKDWWAHLQTREELHPIFNFVQPEKPYQIPEELRQLTKLTHNTDLSDSAKSAYDGAIERLQWLFALSSPLRVFSTIRHLLAWPIQLQNEYLDLMNERRPEALIILAHYAVLLHFYRGSWVVEDAGLFLIKAINAHVGRYWEKWMAWPNKIIGSSGKTP